MRPIETILLRLQSCACKFPLREWDEPPRFSPGLAAAELARVPSTAPGDLLLFLSCCSEISGADVHNGYFIGGKDVLDPSIRPELPTTIESQPLLPVGSDGGGNAFLLCLSAPHTVYKWHHETGSTEKIANSFVAFLDRVATDWERYIDDDPNHEYISC